MATPTPPCLAARLQRSRVTTSGARHAMQQGVHRCTGCSCGEPEMMPWAAAQALSWRNAAARGGSQKVHGTSSFCCRPWTITEREICNNLFPVSRKDAPMGGVEGNAWASIRLRKLLRGAGCEVLPLLRSGCLQHCCTARPHVLTVAGLPLPCLQLFRPASVFAAGLLGTAALGAPVWWDVWSSSFLFLCCMSQQFHAW